ncbi:hypothetical protein GCM10010483_60110 [Actinokineospora diospyrosa]
MRWPGARAVAGGGDFGRAASGAVARGAWVRVGVLDAVNLFCAGPLQHPWQVRTAGAEKTGPAARKRYVCCPPAQNKFTASSSWHRGFRVAKSWLGGRGGADWSGAWARPVR